MNILRVSFIFILIFVSLNSFGQPAEVVGTYGSEFSLHGNSFRFIGVNIRGICHYGYEDILPYTNSGHIDENLSGVASMGGKVIRLFAPVKFAAHQQNVDRLKIVLDKMEPIGLKAIVCLTDVYNTGFNPQGDESYYLAQPGGWTLLDDTWFSGGYQNNYLPFVELAVTQLKNHNAIFAWELGNEITDIKNPNNIITFTSNTASAIKAIDPYHMVTTGFISIDHTQIGESAGYTLYSDPNLDFITVHSYNGEYHWANHDVHSKAGKPLLMEEYGWSEGNGDRVANALAQMGLWIDGRSVRGFMQWGYQAQSYDIGDGDNVVGMDRYAHSDYSQLFTNYQSRASSFTNDPLPERLTPSGENVAIYSIDWRADSSYDGNNTGDKAFDGVVNSSNKWTSSGSIPPHWLAIDLGQNRNVSGYTVRMAGAGGERFDYAFKEYEIQSGSSLDGPWTTEFSVNNTAQFSSVSSIYDDSVELRYIRIYITNSGIDNYCRLPEFEVYEDPESGISLWKVY